VRTIVYFFTLLLFYLTVSVSCTKPATDTPEPVDSLPPPGDTSTFSVENKWECAIDGITYSGVVDTSFLQVVFPYRVDSVIICTGTSADKKAHIHFKVTIDRTKFPDGVNNNFDTYLVFDTAANNLFLGSVSSETQVVTYKLDTMIEDNVVISYSGTVTDQKFINHTVTGKFSCKLNTGSNEPNKFYCLLGLGSPVKRFGYFKSAMMNANTLVLEGVDYMDYPPNQFQMLIRTGGTIKPGIYKSSDGDVNFVSVPPGPVDNNYYIDDVVGDMTVTIESVNGNIVKGSFSGVNKALDSVQSGSFICRVTNYIPEADASNKWAFNTINWAWNDVYNCFAGNVTNAVKTNVGGRYYLTINGESDNRASVFKLVVSSSQPLARGEYQMAYSYDPYFDTVYFKSDTPMWFGNMPYVYADASTIPYGGETVCYIDTLDDNHVVGSFYGKVSGTINGNMIRKGSFNAKF